MQDPWSDITGKVATHDLALQWLEILAPFGAEEVMIRGHHAELVAAYCSPDRHYHTLEHVRQMLSILQGWRIDSRSMLALPLAAWFHDAVYDTRRQDNEQRSAELAEEKLAELRVPADVVAEVQRLILLTRLHTPDATWAGNAFIDADLAILGAPEQVYHAYGEGIRREYGWVPESDYRAGRARFLERLLAKPRIYATDVMHELLGERARRNLTAELQSLLT